MASSSAAEAVYGTVQAMAQFAFMPSSVSAPQWGVQLLLKESQQFRLSSEQQRALEALESRGEQAVMGLMGGFARPDTALIVAMWGRLPVDPADLAMAAFRQIERERRAVVEMARIREEMLALLDPAQRMEYLQFESAGRQEYAAMGRRSVPEAMQFLAEAAESGVFAHPLLLAGSQSAALRLEPAEAQRIQALQGELTAALNVYRASMERDMTWVELTVAELQAALDTAQPAGLHVAALAGELVRLRDESYAALAPQRAAALEALQTEVAGRQFQPRRFPAHLRQCREGGVGGGGVFEDGLSVGYGLRYRGDVADIRILVIGRGHGGRFRGRSEPSMPRTGFGAGFSMGRWMIMHEEQAGRLWMDEVQVELGDANVVILDLDDVTDAGVPHVAAMLRIEPVVQTGGCADADMQDVLRAHIFGHPQLQPYLGR